MKLSFLTTYEAMENSGYSPINGYSNNGYPNNDGYSNARGDQMRNSRMIYNDRMSNMSRSGRDRWYPEEMSYRMRPDMRSDMY